MSEQETGKSCTLCGQQITAGILTVGTKPYHPDCFPKSEVGLVWRIEVIRSTLKQKFAQKEEVEKEIATLQDELRTKEAALRVFADKA